MSFLIEKANDNNRIAKISVEKGCFDVAVSRFYYYIFESIIHFMDEIPIDINNKNGNKHAIRISAFIKHYKTTDQYESNRTITKIWRLRDKRNISDYNPNQKIKTFDEFNNIFYKDYKEVETKLIELGIIKG